MLKLSLFEFVVRTIPESFVFIFCLIAFSNERVKKKNFIISGVMLCLGVFLVRLLPINYGVHVVLNIIILVCISNIIYKMEIINALKSSILITVLSFLFEGINVAVLSIIYKNEFEMIIANTYAKTIFGLPSLILLFITGITYFKIKSKKEEV